MRELSVLIKPVSGLCNMACEYCFYEDEMKNRQVSCYDPMSYDTLENIIRKVLRKAEYAAHFAFQGGEPTLRGLDFYQKVVQLQKEYNGKHIQITNALQTNGYVMDENWCEFFRKHDFLIGLSVDGTGEIHDKYRHDKIGNKTYEKIYRAARLFDHYGVSYNILTVVTKDVAEHVGQIYEVYKRNGWNYLQFILCLEPMSKENRNYRYAPEPALYGRFLTELFDLWYEDIKKGEQPFIRQFENMIAILLGHMPESCEMRGTCSMQYVVEADGSVYPCDFYVLDQWKLGNFNTEPISSFGRQEKEVGFVAESYKISDTCKSCKYYRLCRGGCRRNRVWDAPSKTYQNIYCESYRYFYDHCLERLQQLVTEIQKK